MATVSWALLRELSVSEWSQVTRSLTVLVEKGLPVLLEAQQNAPLDKGWRSFLFRRQRELFLKMNSPPSEWGLEGKGFDSVRLVLLPGRFSVDERQHALDLSIQASRLPHKSHAEVGQRLHAFAWLGVLLWEHYSRPGIWRFQTDLPEEDLASIRAWAVSILSEN